MSESEAARDGRAAAAWLAVLGQLAARASHEVRNVLNGAVLNIEAIRALAGRDGSDAGSVGPFADAAAREVGRVSMRVLQFLELVRPPKVAVDVHVELQRLWGLVGTDGGNGSSLDLAETGGDGAGATTSSGATHVRLALGGALLAASLRDGPLTCRTESGDRMTVYIECAGDPPVLDAAVISAVREGGIEVRQVARGVALTFPPPE